MPEGSAVTPDSIRIGDTIAVRGGWARVKQINSELISGSVGEPAHHWRIFTVDDRGTKAVVTVRADETVSRDDK